MITLCLINAGRDDDLVACAEMLARHRTEQAFDVVVVEAGTDADTKTHVLQLLPEAVMIPAPKFGVATMRNLGFAGAKGDVIVFLDTDASLHDGALDELTRMFDRYCRTAVVGAKLVNPDSSLQYSVRRFYTPLSLLLRRVPGRLAARSRPVVQHLMLDWDHADDRTVDWVIGACFAVRTAAAASIGLFTERSAFGFEDVDYCYRAWQAGWEVRYAPDAVVTHRYVRSSKGLNRRTLSHVGAALQFAIRIEMRRLRAAVGSA